MFGEHRHSGESPRFPSPWQQALCDPSINIKVSPIPSPFLTATTTERPSLDDAAWIRARRGKTDLSRSDDEVTAGSSLSSISDDEAGLHSSHEDLERSGRAPSSSSYTSTTPSVNLSSPPTPRTPPSHSLHHPPIHHYPSGQSLILSPSRNGSTTKLVAERDKTGHIEYKLKLDAKVGGERFERLVTQLRWRLTEGGGEAMYELGILDDGTLIGIPRSLMELSLKTLELMAAELGATVMVLRVINLTSPPPIDGRLGVRLGEASGSVRRYRGRGGRGRGRGKGAGHREKPTDGATLEPDGEQDDEEEDDYRSLVGNARVWTPNEGETIEEPYVSSARRRRDSALRKEKARQANLRRKERVGSDPLREAADSTGTSEMYEEEKRIHRLSAKQRKQLTKRMIYDSVSPSEEEREFAKSMDAEDNPDATMNQRCSGPVDHPKRTLEVDGRIYGPDEDWPVIIPQPLISTLSANNADPSTSVPASWKERNLAQYALASDADGKWKAKREYGQAEKEMIRRERRERKRERKKSREVESAEGSGSRAVGRGSVDKDEEEGWGMFEMDRMGDEPDERDESTGLKYKDAIAKDRLLRQQDSHQRHNLDGSQPTSSPSSAAPSPSPDPPKQHRSKRKMRQSDPRRQQRKESRRLDLLRGDGTNWVNPYAQACEEFGTRAQAGDLGEFTFDLSPTGREDDGSGSASAMGGFGLGGGDSSDEEGLDVRGVVNRMVRQSGAFDDDKDQDEDEDQDEADSGFLDILASPGVAGDRSCGMFPANLATSPTKTIQTLSPRPASVFALPPHQHALANDLIPSPTDTITLPMDNLSLSFSHAEVCAQDDAIGGSSDDSMAENARAEEEPRVCVEALVVKKIELEDRLYLDFSSLG